MKTDEMAEMLVAEMQAAIERVASRTKTELRAEFAKMVADEIEFDGSRTLRIGVREHRMPWPIYRGSWVAQQVYEPGDMCTSGGALFHCGEKTSDRPGTSQFWRLVVKNMSNPGRTG